MSWVCQHCGFDLWVPVATVGVSEVGFYDDDRFPGRCIVALREHYEHLDEVPADLRRGFSDDVARVGAALRATVAPARVNYAVLGNTVAHVHCHVIPRPHGDPAPTRPPWEHPAPRAANAPGTAEALVNALRAALSTAST